MASVQGKNNQIWVDSKPHMKHSITPFEGKNELVALADLIFGNFFLKTNLGFYLAQPSLVIPGTQLELLPSPTGANELFIVDSSGVGTSVGRSSCTYDVWNFFLQFKDTRGLWSWSCFSRTVTEKKPTLKLLGI